jgi:hypothetical protein
VFGILPAALIAGFINLVIVLKQAGKIFGWLKIAAAAGVGLLIAAVIEIIVYLINPSSAGNYLLFIALPAGTVFYLLKKESRKQTSGNK